MSVSGKQRKGSGRECCHWSRVLALVFVTSLNASCPYKPTPLTPLTINWEGGVQIEAQILSGHPTVDIHWTGSLISAADHPKDLTVEESPDIETEASAECLRLVPDDHLVSCDVKDNLRPGMWTFTVNVQFEGADIAGSPFLCENVAINDFDDADEDSDSLRGRTVLRLIEGMQAPVGCVCLGGGCEEPPGRVTQGLVALYDFEGGSGRTVADKSGVGVPLDLTIDEPDDPNNPEFAWNDDSLSVNEPTLIATSIAATKVIERAQSSNEITVEAWVQPALVVQGPDAELPARIVTLSEDQWTRNFTLGQHSVDQVTGLYQVRLRTTSDLNGAPFTATANDTAKNTGLQHVVFTFDSTQLVTVYLNSVLMVSQRIEGGTFSGWDAAYRLGLANEISDIDARPWLGDYHLVAIYSRALTRAEVGRNFQAGPYIDQ